MQKRHPEGVRFPFPVSRFLFPGCYFTPLSSSKHAPAPPSNPVRKFCIRWSFVPWAMPTGCPPQDHAVDPAIAGQLRRGVRGRRPQERLVHVALLERAIAVGVLREGTGQTVGCGFVVVWTGCVVAELHCHGVSHSVCNHRQSPPCRRRFPAPARRLSPGRRRRPRRSRSRSRSGSRPRCWAA